MVSSSIVESVHEMGTLENRVPPPPVKQNRFETITKSPADKREYLGLILENKMKVLLISDPKADISAASMTLAAGSMSEPDTLPGLAHFCEHMLFLGTEKYPIENSFQKFLQENGGYTDAYTSDDTTTYYFSIDPNSLASGLDRFAQFFITPLFPENATEREVNALNSEHDQNIPNDYCRCWEISRTTAKPGHPFAKFGTGNFDTLWKTPKENKINIRDALMEFHKDFYSANIMCLAVLGKESLSELESFVKPLFNQVKNNEIKLPYWSESPYGPEQLQTWTNVMPIKDLREIFLAFPIPDMTQFHECKPVDYISNLVGHDGKGSLALFLKKKNWITNLYGGGSVTARGFGSFDVTITLTPEGLEHTHDIINHVFQYLEMLRQSGPQKYFWEELKATCDISFRYQDTWNPITIVQQLSSDMIVYPVNEIFTADKLLSNFRPELIQQVMSFLTVDNCRVVLLTHQNESKGLDMTEAYYGIKYSTCKIDQDVLKKWKNCGTDEQLTLPIKNDFIPERLDLRPRMNTGQGHVPKIIMETGLSRVWFLQDNEFLLPKGMIGLDMYSPLPLRHPLSYALNDLFSNMINDALVEYSYPAELAGLYFSVMPSFYGQRIWVRGYNDKLDVLLQQVMDKFINYNPDPLRFSSLKEEYTRTIKNWCKDQPHEHCSEYMNYFLREKYWTYTDLEEILEDMTFDKFKQYCNDFLTELKLEWFVYGNFTDQDAKDVVVNIHGILNKKGITKPLAPGTHVLIRDVQLDEGADYVYKKDHLHHSDSCLSILYQAGLQSTRENVLIELLEQIASEPCFTQLRTEQQLGYLVWAVTRTGTRILGFTITVQSNSHPEFLDCRVDNFLENLHSIICDMTEEDFTQHRQALIVRKSEEPKNIWDRGYELSAEIFSRQLNFDRRNMAIAELRKISHEDMILYFSRMFGPPAEQRRRLTIHIMSVTEAGAGNKDLDASTLERIPKYILREPQVITDVSAWKSGRYLCPIHYPDYTKHKISELHPDIPKI